MPIDIALEQKKIAANKAVEFVESGMTVGLGTGSTAEFAIESIAKKFEEKVIKNLVFIASSKRTENFAEKLGIRISNFKKNLDIDINIDGADEVDSQMNLIKGGGGALLREKVLAQASKKNVVIVDESKISDFLGEKWSVPVEVLPFAWKLEHKYLESIGAKAELRKDTDRNIFITDQDNYILDCNFGLIKDPKNLSITLSSRAGIMEHGIFADTTTDLIVGTKNGVIHKPR